MAGAQVFSGKPTRTAGPRSEPRTGSSAAAGFELVLISTRPAAVLLSADDYEAMCETMAVLADTELMRTHREGQAAIATGDYLDADQLAEHMRRAGRGR